MSSPVIIITGTPGSGKSTLAALLAADTTLQHINIGDWVKQRHLHHGYDPDWQAYTVDEDKLLDELEPIVADGGVILDWHSCDLFPERWPDLVVVLRCNHTKLWDRLQIRGYPLIKIQENNEAEIMQVVLDEARASYPHEIVVEMQSDSIDDLHANLQRILDWIAVWRSDHKSI